MEFWGIDRSRTSLRLQVLESITQINDSHDISRLVNGIPEQNFEQLSPTEIETLLAFARHLDGKSEKITDENMRNLILSLLKVAPFIASRINFDLELLATETWFLRLHKNPCRILTKSLVRILAISQDYGDLHTFFTRLESMLGRVESKTMSNPELIAYYGAVCGTLEGLSNCSLDSEFFETLFPILLKISAADFSLLLPFDFGVHELDAQFLVSKILANVSPSIRDRALLDNITEYCFKSYDKFEHIHAEDQESFDIVRLTMKCNLMALHSMLSKQVVRSELFYTYVLRALSYKTPEPMEYAIALGDLCASITLNHEKRLIQILELFPEFLGELNSHVAHQSAVTFANLYMQTRSSKAFRIRAIYAITNKITAEEVANLRESHGEQRMLECLAAMLSALVAFVKTFNSSEIADLTVTILEQKLNSINIEVDCQVVETWGLLTPYISAGKFKEVLELLVFAGSSANHAPMIVNAITNARVTIAKNRIDDMYLLEHLLNLVIHKTADKSDWVSQLIKPIAHLPFKELDLTGWKNQEIFRNAWFNLALQGVTRESLIGENLKNFRIVAKYAPPLVCEESANHIESDLKLNSVLCRGVSSQVLKVQRHALSKVLGSQLVQNSEQVKVMFLAAAYLLEGLRMEAGSVCKLPNYFEDTEFSTNEGFNQMSRLTSYLMTQYVSTLGYELNKDMNSVAKELRELLVHSCHRVEVVRKTANHMINQIIQVCPAALGQHNAIFTLLECLSLLREAVDSCIVDRFSPKVVFQSELTKIKIMLNDNLDARQSTFRSFEKSALHWLGLLNQQMREDLRSKLFTYLSHPSVKGEGRKFALSLLTRDDVNDDVIVKYVLLNQYDTNMPLQPVDLIIQLLETASNSDDLHKIYSMAAPLLRACDHNSIIVAQECVRAPFRIFTDEAVNSGITFWHYVIRHQNKLRSVIVSEVLNQTVISAQQHRGLFSQKLDTELPLWSNMEYAPTNKRLINRQEQLVINQFQPHSRLMVGFIKSGVHNSVMLNSTYLAQFVHFFINCLQELSHGSNHVLALYFRLDFYESAIDLLHIIKSLRSSFLVAQCFYQKLENALFDCLLSWYKSVSTWPYGSNTKIHEATLQKMKSLASWINKNVSKGPKWELLSNFVLQDISKMEIWLNPLMPKGRAILNTNFSVAHLKLAWEIDPDLAVSICRNWKFNGEDVFDLLVQLIHENPLAVYSNPEALCYYLDATNKPSHYVLYWAQVSPIMAISLLSPQYKSKFVVQYALRALQSHDINLCFFYVPQVVQQLRHDDSGYVEEYILEAAKVSQKFAHQIIWNIMANMYTDDDGTVPSDMKPKLEHVLNKMKEEFTPEDKQYYETEFHFFSEVTGISGKLKPYIKKSKPEKKAKIDEEMAKIKVPQNVYLPSHPDGVVVDIDRSSGKPLQSHAKAPFLAKFKIRVNEEEIDEKNQITNTEKEVWQGAIFKVGDDCRQDVLALQLISVFRSIFNYSGLDVWVFPYKVTATAAGRGIIDVLPNSISRDMLGREAVNGLVQWYHSKHGGPDSLDFQRARLNFVKSMASYSVISYLIQFKDRHNGNIMYDDEGHVIHIDFGFCFDIVPGGVRFEAAPFKLTKEMVQVMGGSAQAVPFKWFEEQCVRVFLASRLLIDDICRVVEPMLESGLPCFKNNTIKKLRERFVPQKTDAEAAQYMRSLISKSYESNFTRGYDEFQKFTNGIPY